MILLRVSNFIHRDVVFQRCWRLQAMFTPRQTLLGATPPAARRNCHVVESVSDEAEFRSARENQGNQYIHIQSHCSLALGYLSGITKVNDGVVISMLQVALQAEETGKMSKPYSHHHHEKKEEVPIVHKRMSHKSSSYKKSNSHKSR